MAQWFAAHRAGGDGSAPTPLDYTYARKIIARGQACGLDVDQDIQALSPIEQYNISNPATIYATFDGGLRLASGC